MPGIQNILVAFDGRPAARSALRTAMHLAQENDAHVTGCFPYASLELLGTAENWVTRGVRSKLRDIARRIGQEAEEAVAEVFHEITVEFGRSDQLHWLKVLGNSDIAVTKSARYFDLTVIGAASPQEVGDLRMVHPDVVALRSGKSVLVVPEGCHRLPKRPRVVIAWDGKRAAARASGEAMQLLGGFASATILTVGSRAEPDHWLSRMAEHLRRHGIKADTVRREVNGSVGETIITHCRERQADLLIMGAYEHSKFSEDILGGTTNEVLGAVATPVFMAH